MSSITNYVAFLFPLSVCFAISSKLAQRKQGKMFPRKFKYRDSHSFYTAVNAGNVTLHLSPLIYSLTSQVKNLFHSQQPNTIPIYPFRSHILSAKRID